MLEMMMMIYRLVCSSFCPLRQLTNINPPDVTRNARKHIGHKTYSTQSLRTRYTCHKRVLLISRRILLSGRAVCLLSGSIIHWLFIAAISRSKICLLDSCSCNSHRSRYLNNLVSDSFMTWFHDNLLESISESIRFLSIR